MNEQAKRLPVIAIEFSDKDQFQEKCENLITNGYKIMSSSCGFVDSSEYDFCSVYQAIFIDEGLSDD